MMLIISPAAMESHTPSMPIIRGRTRTGSAMKTIVRQKESMADTLPSLSAVNQPEANTLYAIMIKLTAAMWKPCSAMPATFTLPLANTMTTPLPKI